MLLLVIVVAAAYWWYQGWSWRQWREIFPFLETSLGPTAPQAAAQPAGTGTAVMAGFLGGLPARATLDFLDAGAGIMIYRVQGDELGQVLRKLNADVQGHRFSDLVTPSRSASYWLGTVAFASRNQAGALRPVRAEYDRFFRLLQDQIRSTGGVVVEMVPGTMTAGEYVIRGSLDEIRAHLAAAARDSINVFYHRLSLLKSATPPEGLYLLRVTFNLVEEQVPSPPPSLPEDTGA